MSVYTLCKSQSCSIVFTSFPDWRSHFLLHCVTLPPGYIPQIVCNLCSVCLSVFRYACVCFTWYKRSILKTLTIYEYVDSTCLDGVSSNVVQTLDSRIDWLYFGGQRSRSLWPQFHPILMNMILFQEHLEEVHYRSLWPHKTHVWPYFKYTLIMTKVYTNISYG